MLESSLLTASSSLLRNIFSLLSSRTSKLGIPELLCACMDCMCKSTSPAKRPSSSWSGHWRCTVQLKRRTGQRMAALASCKTGLTQNAHLSGGWRCRECQLHRSTQDRQPVPSTLRHPPACHLRFAAWHPVATVFIQQ
jgi:hypothetical protein